MRISSTPLLALAFALTVLAACAPVEHTDDAKGPASAAIAATVGDREFSLEEVDVKAKATDDKPYQALYDARQAALAVLIEDHLMTLAAKSRGVSKEALIEQEVTQKTPAVTEEALQSFFEQNKAAVPGRTYEQVKPQIEGYLKNQSRQAAHMAFMRGLREETKVRVLLEPPRTAVTIAANDPTKGPAGAPIQILEFSDFQ